MDVLKTYFLTFFFKSGCFKNAFSIFSQNWILVKASDLNFFIQKRYLSTKMSGFDECLSAFTVLFSFLMTNTKNI